MLRKIRRIHKGQKGITGLETAIILIAFVVVAAVFAYTALSAGLFSTQKSQEAVYSGLEEVQSTIELKGGVIAKDNDTDNYVNELTFTLVNAMGGEAIDFTVPTDGNTDGLADATSTNVVVISYIDTSVREEDLYWTITKLGDYDADSLLEEDEKFQISIPRLESVTSLANHIGSAHTFTIEIKTSQGATLTIERTTPAYIDAVQNLN